MMKAIAETRRGH